MKKVVALSAGAVGFVLGSRAGRGPYEQIERWARQVAKRPAVRRVTDQLGTSASQVCDTTAQAVSSVANQASGAVTQATQSAADTVTRNIDKAGKQASERVDETAGRLRA
jgi:replicative DNA helicase